jgi:hypothetical protein
MMIEGVASIRALDPSHADEKLAMLFPATVPEAKRAGWLYRHVCTRLALEIDPEFELRYVEALRDEARAKAFWNVSCGLLDERIEPATVVLSWHFPEHPYLGMNVLQSDAAVLVAEEDPWLSASGGASLLINFRSRGGLRRLYQAFRQGRPIVANIDHCYPGTGYVWADFLGYPARTPIGIFKLALRFGYAVKIVMSTSDGRSRLIALQKSGNAADLCTAATAMIERAIVARPSRWTMWPALDSRWPPISYM